MGRAIEIQSPDGSTFRTFDGPFRGIGELASVQSTDGVTTTFEYDEAARPLKESRSIPGLTAPMVMTRLYDELGRPSGRLFSGIAGASVQLDFRYSVHNPGHLLQVSNAATPSTPIWRVENRSAYGTVAQEIFGNELRVTREQGPVLDQLMGLRAAFVPGGLAFNPENASALLPVVGNGTVQSLAFGYDFHRNLTTRTDDRATPNVQDTFGYDGLDRLKSWLTQAGGIPTSFGYNYDPLTNFNERTVAGSGTPLVLNHDGAAVQAGPNAITSGPAGSYTYNARGLQTSGPGRAIEYTADELPRSVTYTEGALSFLYDGFAQRVSKSDGLRRTFYGPGYERRVDNGQTVHVFDVPGEDRIVAQMFLEEQNGQIIGPPRYEYIHDDHLGSTDVVTGAGGQTLGRVRWDPFGMQVQPNNPTLPASGLPGSIRLGFTGHEHDQELGLVNMGGRIYEPGTGHFLTPDPLVGQPFDATAFNGYSYVLNNPTTLIDPTGFQADTGPGTPVPRPAPFPLPFPPPPAPGGAGNPATPPTRGDAGSRTSRARDSGDRPSKKPGRAGPAPGGLPPAVQASAARRLGSQGGNAVAPGAGIPAMVSIPAPGTGGLSVSMWPNGWTPASGSTSVLFIQNATGKVHLRLDSGFNKPMGVNNVHWNQKGTLPLFGINNHTPAGTWGQALYAGARTYRLVGTGLVAVGAGMDAFAMATSARPMLEATRIAGGWTGAIIGAKGLGAAGAAIGSAVPGAGTATGALVGGAIGGAAGYFGGSQAAYGLWKWIVGE
jgi:RHS repeat-associated protein